MALSDDNLMISDKVWILVGMLLRNGQSCSPSQLSDLCHMLSFSPSEIDWLCKLPFSPLCLSQCGQVTFSQFVFHFFEAAKDRYAPPSMNLASWNFSYMDTISTSSFQRPIVLSQKLCQSLLVYEVSPDRPFCDSSPGNLGRSCPEDIHCSHGVPKPSSPSVRKYFRKRHRSIIPDTPNKKQHVSTVTCCTQSVGSKKTNLFDLGRCSITSKQSRAGDAEKRNTSSTSLDAKQLFQPPVKSEAVQHDATFTDCLSSYTQQSCTASVPCRGNFVAGIDNDISINLSFDREVCTVEFGKDEERESLHITGRSAYNGSSRKLATLENLPDSQNNAILAYGQFSKTIVENNGTNGLKRHSPTHEDPQIIHRSLQFAQNSSSNHTGVLGASCDDGEAVTCSKQWQGLAHDDDHIRGDLNKNVGPACKLTKQDRGKAAKDPHHKNCNSKQMPKLRKLKKPSGTKNRHAAGCSAIVEACSDQVVEEKHPSFDGFIVEAVEGSGGYGTVFKAMKKDGGKLVAIKYPFERTSLRHVQNEIRVLQKYGGQNFIPKCLDVIEESGKQCLVLDYIEHEKPEILKREISISQLQLYGFSLFKALEYLHSKGVIHRDVKPGNFLFSRNKRCGWLIDFNLATVQTKLSNSGKYHKRADGKSFEKSRKVNESHRRNREALVAAHRTSSSLGNQNRNVKMFVGALHQDVFTTPGCTPTREFRGYTQGITGPQLSQSLKHAELTTHTDLCRLPTETEAAMKTSRTSSGVHRSPLKEQGMALNSAEFQKEEQVIPRYGRRELWELVQKSWHSTPAPVSSIPSSQKKRVAAPQKRKHQRPFLEQSLAQSSALAVSKTSLSKMPATGRASIVRGLQKSRKEGTCVGTKGYRAPEVLLKSLCQSEKIDIWSAGVSLFQLILGKSPFSSSSNLNQSLLDIAQFCGADAIFALAKEHNREASLSKELIAMKGQATSLSLWFEKNTKRQNLLSLIPPGLFDLLEKCLQIDPKNRISATEALQHEFFDACHNSVPLSTSFTN